MAVTNERSAALGAKSPHRLAEEIERQIIARGWPVGENLGAESELAARYGVGRGVVRQALTLVVRSGLAEVRRGREGGLVVAAPTQTAAATALRAHLDLRPIRLDDIFLARRRFDELMLRLAVDRQSEADAAGYAELLDAQPHAATPQDRLDFATRMLQAVRGGAHNDYLSLIASALVGLSWSRLRGDVETPQGHRLLAIADLRGRQLKSVFAGDLGEALALNCEIYGHYDELVSTVEPMEEPASLERVLTGRSSPEKLGEQIARQIKAQIARGDLKPGDRIGSEAELMAQYEASRGVVRDAIRILEHLSLAASMRGKAGGLYVTRPTPNSVLRTAGLYLRARGVATRAIREVGETLDVFAAELASRRSGATASEMEAFFRRTDALDAAPLRDRSLAYYRILAELAGSPLLSLLLPLQASLVEIYPQAPLTSEPFRKLLAAIQTGDAAAARNAMHLLRRRYRFHTPPASTFEERGMLELLGTTEGAER